MRRKPVFVVAALALALGLWWLWGTPRSQRLEPLAVDLIRMAPELPPGDVVHDGPDVGQALRVVPPPPRAMPPPTAVQPPAVEPPPLPPVPAPPPWTAPPPPPIAMRPWSSGLPDVAPAPAPTAPPRRRLDPNAATRLLQDGLIEHDGHLGLTFPGASQIAAAVASAVRAHAPPVASVQFVAHVGSDGQVSSLRHRSHAGGTPELWSQAAADAAGRLTAARFDLRGALAGGALVTVTATSNLELPSGVGRRRRLPPRRAAPRPDRPAWPWAPSTGPRASWREEGSWTALSPEVSGFCAPPEATLPPCDPGAALCPGGKFDLSDIGAHPARVVRTQVEVCAARYRGGPRRRGDP